MYWPIFSAYEPRSGWKSVHAKVQTDLWAMINTPDIQPSSPLIRTSHNPCISPTQSYIYIYVYISIRPIYFYIHIDLHIYICIYLHTYIHVSISVSIYRYPCIYIWFKAGSQPLRFYTFFSSRHERHSLQTAHAAALGNNAIYLAERKSCATLYTTAVRLVVIASDPVAATLTLLELHCCDCYFLGSYVLLMKS